MKGIETSRLRSDWPTYWPRSDHCPAMKGIETISFSGGKRGFDGSDHCPAMKGIETTNTLSFLPDGGPEATIAPQ